MPRYSEVVQGVVKEINDLRRNPQSFLDKLTAYLAGYRGLMRHRSEDAPVLTREGRTPVLEAIDTLRALPPLRTCQWNEALGSSAQAHCLSLSSQSVPDIQLTNPRVPIELYGKWTGDFVEMLDFGGLSPTEIVCSLLVDDGLPSRDHRTSLLAADFRHIGVGCAPHCHHTTVTTILMASKFTAHSKFERCFPPGDVIPVNRQAAEWLEGAVKVTCEVETETVQGVVRKKVVKVWEMENGETEVREESLGA